MKQLALVEPFINLTGTLSIAVLVVCTRLHDSEVDDHRESVRTRPLHTPPRGSSRGSSRACSGCKAAAVKGVA